MDALVSALTSAAAAWWVYPALFALVIGDAFLVVLPSETAVVALASLAVAGGHPFVPFLLAVAALGAIVGDSVCFGIGRRIHPDRIGLLRGPRATAALAAASRTIHARPAVVILTARYVPFARIAANLAAGSSGFAYRRFLPLSAVAGCCWAAFNVAVGTIFGAWLGDSPVLAVAVSVVVAIGIGLTVDRTPVLVTALRRRISARNAAARAPADVPAAPATPPES